MKKTISILFLLIMCSVVAVAQSTEKKMIIHVNSVTGMEFLDGKIAIPIDNIREMTFEGLASDSITPTPSGVKAIRFQFKDNSSPVTRAPRREAPALQNRRYGVFASYKRNEKDVQLMNNQEVEFLDNEWTYFPIKYWPRNEQEEGIPTSFYAYSPYSEPNGFVRTNYETGEPLLEYSSSNPMDDAGDLLYGSLLDATEETNGGLATIQSKHALARFDLSANVAFEMDSSTKVTIKSMKIEGIPLAGTFNLRSQQWTNLSIPSEGFTIEGDKLSPDIRDTDDYANLPAGVLPVEQSIATSPCLFLPTDEEQDISFTIEYSVTTHDPALATGYSRVENTIMRNLRFRVNAGYRYNVNFVLGYRSIMVEMTVNSEWDDNTSTIITR